MLQLWEAGPAVWLPPLPSSLPGAESRRLFLAVAGVYRVALLLLRLLILNVHPSFMDQFGVAFLRALPPVAGRSCVWQCLSGPPCGLAEPRSACSPTVGCRSWQGCALAPGLHCLAPTFLPAEHAIVRVH